MLSRLGASSRETERFRYFSSSSETGTIRRSRVAAIAARFNASRIVNCALCTPQQPRSVFPRLRDTKTPLISLSASSAGNRSRSGNPLTDSVTIRLASVCMAVRSSLLKETSVISADTLMLLLPCFYLYRIAQR